MLRSRIFLVLAVAMAAALIGCGGGGGGFNFTTTGTTNGGGASTLSYGTTWTNQNQSPTGGSEKITILSPTGQQLAQRTINQSASPQTISIGGLPTSFYTVHVDLYSGPDATGAITGSLEKQVQGTTTVSTDVGAALDSILVTPSTASVQIGDTVHFSVAGVDSAGKLTFLAPASITWSSNSPVATVDQNGNATGVAAGAATITATHVPTGKQGSATLTVNQQGRSQWTVMVFLNASNDLYPYAPLDVNEMESVATNPAVRFVVQWKQVQGVGGNQNPSFSGTRRYLVRHDTTNTIASQVVENLGAGVDMGRPETLNEFIAWTKQHYPADRYAVVVWNHGNGWKRTAGAPPPVRAVSYDDETGNAIQTWQLPLAMQNEHVDILSFDACLMQMLEIDTELQPACDFIAASEEDTPGLGYPYDRVFQPFMDNPGASTRDLSKAFVEGHVTLPDYQNQAVTQSVVDPTKIPPLESAVSTLADTLILHKAAIATIVDDVRATALKYAFRGDGRYYYDLWDIANRLQNANTPPDIKAACQAVKDAVVTAVVWEGHTSLSNGSHGISIDFSPRSAFDAQQYSLLRLARETHWDEWLSQAP